MIPILMGRTKHPGLQLPHSDTQSCMMKKSVSIASYYREYQQRLSTEPERNLGIKTEQGEKTYSSKCHSERHLFAFFNLFLSLVTTQT